MGKNHGKGGKSFRSGKGDSEGNKRELFKKETDTEDYARIKKALGCGKMACILADGSTIIGSIRGAMTRKKIISAGATVLVDRREFQTNVVDIIHLYNDDEVKELTRMGEIPTDFRDANDTSEPTSATGHRWATKASQHADKNLSEADRKLQEEIEAGGAVREYDPLADFFQNGEAGGEEEEANLDDI